MQTISVDTAALEKLREAGSEGLVVTGADGRPVAKMTPLTAAEHVAFAKSRLAALHDALAPQIPAQAEPHKWLSDDNPARFDRPGRRYTPEEVQEHLRKLSK